MAWYYRRLQFVGLILSNCLLATVAVNNTYCDWQHTPATGRVHFTDKPGPATLAIACEHQQVDLICCMAEFTHIDWFVWDKLNKAWLDFFSLDPDKRDWSSEQNQTVTIVYPTADDSTDYQCVGYGQTTGDIIRNVVRLQVRNCTDWHQPPQRLLPLDNESIVEADLGENLSVPCSGFYGKLQASSIESGIGWFRRRNQTEIDDIYENKSERIHTVTVDMNNNNTKRCTLYIMNVTDDDYGLYECWMVNSYGYTEPDILVSLQHRKPVVVVVDASFKVPSIISCCAVGLIVLLTVIGYRNRNNIRLSLKQCHRTHPHKEGLLYDIVLFHVESSTVSTSLGEYLYKNLTTGRNFKPFSVYYVNNDVMPNESIFSALNTAVLSTRCVVAIVCPTFIQQPQCRQHLLHILPLCHVVYVLHAGITSSRDVIVTSQLEESVQVSMRNSGRTVVWKTSNENCVNRKGDPRLSSVEEAGKLIDSASSPTISESPGLETESGKWVALERQDKRQVDNFWREFLLAIPNNKLPSTNNAAQAVTQLTV